MLKASFYSESSRKGDGAEGEVKKRFNFRLIFDRGGEGRGCEKGGAGWRVTPS